jgi:hypothetical protein
MATKKIKRFQEGGMSDKDRGLEASKDEKVGFFERLRMGNIDDEGSEAYRRFGAGRGKAERTPVETMAATPVTRPTAAAPEMDAMEEANTRVDRMLVPNQSVADQPKPGSRPRVNVQAAKPSAPVKSSPKMQEQTYRRTSGDTGEREPAYRRTSGDTGEREPAYTRKGGATADDRAMATPTAPAAPKPSMRRGTVSDIPLDAPRKPVTGEKVDGTELGRNVATTVAALGPVKGAGAVRAGAEYLRANRVQDAFNKTATARRTAEARAKGDATKFASKPKATQKNTAKKTKKFDDEESNIEFKRGGKAYAAGGSVSSASKRGDGIATRGKTNCKMR